MKLSFAIACLLASLAFASAGVTPAQAVKSVRSGYCPAGTCADNGGRYANNVGHCKASNCQGGVQGRKDKR